MKIALIGSSGGHLHHLWLLKQIWEKHDRYWVTFNKLDATSLLANEQVFFCHYPTNRNIINLIKNYFLAKRILIKEKPDLIISSGAAVAYPFFKLAKKMDIKTVFIEVYDRIDNPTLTGRLVYKYSDLFIVQWPELLVHYPRAKYIGGII